MKRMTTIKAYTGLSGLLKAGLILLFSAWSGQHIATAQTPAKQLVAEYLQNKENVNLEKISVSIDFEEIPLDEAILRLGEISGVNFNYNADLLSGETNVTYQAENTTLQDILRSILPSNVTYITARNIVILKEKPEVIPEDYFQQSITGTVTDDQTGEVLPGVNVIAGEGAGDSPVGTTTDMNGAYEVELTDEVSTLIFSYVGYERFEVSIEGRTQIDVELAQDVQMLEDVVVVGYSERRQSELSSSVTVVNEEELQRSSITEDLGTMLQGKVPGLIVSNTDGNPGSTTQAVIRGVGSIGAGYSPLYVIDGVIGDRLSVNPSDIESITVLKDAAATGLYGSRAANGVIVITTKRGQAGETRVSYRGSYGISQDRDFETMNSEELYEQYRMGHTNLYNDAVAQGDPNFENLSLDQYLNDVLPSSLLEQNTPWNSLLTRRGYVSQHQLSVSGGNERTTFFVSGNYYDELGTLLGTEYQKFDLRFNLDHQLSETFNLQTRVSTGIDKFPNDPLGGQSSTRTQYYNNIPWDPAFNDEGTPVNPLAPGQGWFGNASSNYFFNRENQESEIKNAYLNVDLELGYDIADWISFSTTNRVGLSGRDFSQVLSQRHEIANAERGRVTQNYRYGNSFLTSNVLNLDHDFSDHSFSGILGQEYSYDTSLITNASGSDIPDGLSALGAAGSPRSVSGGRIAETGFSSFFGQVDYNYRSRYYLVGSLRFDASSRFGANNRWANFYSVGGSWLLSNESFLSDMNWLDILKLKASYGVTGNANIQPYLALGTYAFAANTTYAGLSGTIPARLPNPDLTWEKAYTTNIGLELSLLNRVTFELDFYNRENRDLLQSVALSSASGFATQERNVGAVRNRGLDFTLRTVNVDREIRWESSINVNINNNKVLALNDGEDITAGQFRISEGLTRRHYYMRQWAGVDPQTGDPTWIRWEDENGNRIDGGDGIEPSNVVVTNQYNQASNLFITTAYPDFTGGIQNQLYYKNFSFSVLANFVVGQDIYNAHRMRIDSDGAHMGHNEMKRHDGWVRWMEPGDNATHPRMIAGGNKNSNQQSSRYIENGSYLRIQNVSLGYDLPSVFGLSNVRINAAVDNLYIFTDFSSGDPDVNIEQSVVTQGNARFSPTRKVRIGLNIDF